MAQSLEDSGLVAAMLGNLLSLGLKNGFFLLNGLILDHGTARKSVEGGLDIDKGDLGEGLDGQDGLLLRKGVEDPSRQIPRGGALCGRHGVNCVVEGVESL